MGPAQKQHQHQHQQQQQQQQPHEFSKAITSGRIHSTPGALRIIISVESAAGT
jgi:hypothetical protein